MRNSAEPVVRLASRLIVLDERHRVLLLRGRDRSGTYGQVWTTPGGAVEPGETHEQAARRELWEETGLEVGDLGPCVWERRRVRRDGPGGRWVDSRSRFFLLRIACFTPDLSRNNAVEGIEAYRWWTLDEIAAALPETFIPKRMAELLRPLIEGNIPATPADASD